MFTVLKFLTQLGNSMDYWLMNDENMVLVENGTVSKKDLWSSGVHIVENGEDIPSDTEYLFLELNFRKCKWLLVGTNHPPSKNDHYFFENLDKVIDVYSHYTMEKFYL